MLPTGLRDTKKKQTKLKGFLGLYLPENRAEGQLADGYNLSAGEVVTMDKTGAGLLSSRPDHNILDDFDKNWFSLSDGANSITLEGSASVTLTYREPRKVGV